MQRAFALFVAVFVLACGGGATSATDAGTSEGSDAGGPLGMSLVASVAAGARSFHKDTGGWPLGNAVWYGNTPPWYINDAGVPQYDPVEVSPVQFQANDTALFVQPSDTPHDMNLMHCGTTPCWSGPYLSFAGLVIAGATNMAEVKDAWGHALYYSYIRPFDGNGGGTPSQPNGAVIIWSAGPDGKDQTGCSAGDCVYNKEKASQGAPSVSGADDLITVVATDTSTFQ